MTNRLVWLASYPKSGNTWVRAILSALSVDSADMFDINAMVGRGGPVSPNEFEDIMGVCWSELSIRERQDLLPEFTAELARGVRGIEYHKTHMEFKWSPSGRPVFDGREGAVAVYIARDPRQVVISHAHFFGTGIAESAEIMNDPNRRTSLGDPEIHESVGRWTDHVTGWIGQNHIPVLVVQYEALKADPYRAVRKILDFVGVDFCADTIESAIAATRFDRLQNLEREEGFNQRSTATDRFFRNGTSDEWREVLTTEQQRQIERDQEAGMRLLGYLTDDPLPIRKLQK
ncbi:sulfotransferase domain-containing protein [uncultured Parasphingorhabdus sp.]|uniref:sulfotransferase domain-containing protein n=1 Tax=uncultured Parasphingorhabdus sp. TaxID=2709694 RepID=UPI002AA813DE|nr:sulfotransferase domain-containing protein [uncultured Parasphingorhabdus sp.]